MTAPAWSFRFITMVMISLLVFGPVSASAEEPSSDQWEKYFEVYGWLPDINITMADGSDVTLSLSDILKNLDMIAQFDFGARNDEWSVAADMIYMNLGAKEIISGEILNRPVDVLVDFDMRSFISTLNAGYALVNTEKNRTEVIGGVRYIYIRTPISLEINDNLQRNAYPSGHSWDAIIGLKGVNRINDKWAFEYYGDLGAGQSKFTWQTKLGFSYDFNKWTGAFGFRYMRWNFKSDSAFQNLDVIGPYVAAKWTW